jgi:hypothetical protein
MRRRLTGAILLLYPRRVRKGHGSEIVALIDDLIAHEGRSHTGLLIRLAGDGLVQRIASTAAVWTMVVVLAVTTFGGLAVSNFAAAHALHVGTRTTRTRAPASHEHPAAHQPTRRHRTPHRT